MKNNINFKNNWKAVVKLLLNNGLLFVMNLGFIIVFQILFGSENILTGVAISVGCMMFPVMPLPIKPLTLAGTIVGLYTAGSILGQTALISPWLALPINILFVALMMLLTCEPVLMQPSITFLLCFVFSQSTPVPWQDMPTRVLGAFVGAVFVALVTLLFWKKNGYGTDGRTLTEQVQVCRKNRSYIFRMSVGIGIAMWIGMLFRIKKPLWISIVVMSLTQLEFNDTFQKMKHRAVATVIGAIVFVIFFQRIIPEEYTFFAILALGYLSFFTPEYKHKQIVNTISAMNASLVLLDTTSAIAGRFLCLAVGIAIVLLLWVVPYCNRKLRNQYPEFFKQFSKHMEFMKKSVPAH